jgi:hypothetical protein
MQLHTIAPGAVATTRIAFPCSLISLIDLRAILFLLCCYGISTIEEQKLALLLKTNLAMVKESEPSEYTIIPSTSSGGNGVAVAPRAPRPANKQAPPGKSGPAKKPPPLTKGR